MSIDSVFTNCNVVTLDDTSDINFYDPYRVRSAHIMIYIKHIQLEINF
jgi:hypothetical protein